MAVSGAAPLTRGSYDALSAIIGDNKISDAFGMTETAPCYTANPPKRYKLGSIGFPVPNAKVRIRDVETGNHDMPFGEPGEIVCTGPQVMKGYLNLPNESTKALREIDGERWMFSGDVGYMDEEGYIVALPPCIYGTEDGLESPPRLSLDTNLTAIKKSNATYYHYGVMSHWQMRGSWAD